MRFINTRLTAVVFLTLSSMCALAQDAAAPAAPEASAGGNFLLTRYLLLAVAVVLAFIILLLANGIKTAADVNIEKQIEKRRGTAASVTLSIIALLFSVNVFGQDAAAAPVEAVAPKLSLPFDIYIFLAVILLELIVIVSQVFVLYRLFGLKARKKEALAKAGKKERTFFQKINNTVALEEEQKLDMQHDYDGIRELDNKVPGWWRLAFNATILFGVIYLYRMFVSGSMPDQIAELNRDNEIAAVKQAAYLKNSANNVDENTVTMLDAAGIGAGADVFSKNCVACHGDKGQGNAVGPNLTDDYWLHKGSIKDIFHTIKYGVPEKGMRSWKDDFSPVQIAQLASFVKSLHGTNPPGAKAPQGELYTEGGGDATGAAPAGGSTATAATDSAAAK